MKSLVCLTIGGTAAYAAGGVSNTPFAVFCGAAAVFAFIAAIIFLVEGVL